ncbi:MAG TPA: DUF1573 domain-containing protein [Chitinophagaceae bacterium]|nr:DUF1573 domain-containing protein [Chitinophagaceae bacterium]
MKKIFCTGIVIVNMLVIACTAQENKNAALLKPSQGFLASLDTAHYTTIQWLDSIQNFGTIHEGDSAKLKFTFKNTGTTPLFLTSVRTSCGCTIANFPKQAILPGAESTLTATFNSKFHPGYVHRGIVIMSNTKNGISHSIVLEGNVIKAKSE